MKKRLLLILISALILCLGSCKADTGVAATPVSFHPVSKTGKAEYSGAVLEKELLSQAAAVSDGYLLPANGVEKYDLKGNLLWRKEYPFITGDAFGSSVKITPVTDGSFLVCFDIASYQKPDGTWFEKDPVLAMCDKEGNLLWQKNYEGFSDTTLEKVFCLSDGSVMTIGCAEAAATKQTGTVGPGDIYLSLVDKDGHLMDEKYYGGSNFETFYDAEYIPGVGLVALISTQSGDGTFSASKSGYGEDVLLLIGDDLNIQWQKPLGTILSNDSMKVTREAIYLLDLQNNYRKVDFSGNVVYCEPFFSKEEHARLIGNSRYGLLIQRNDGMAFYHDRDVALKFDWDAGYASRVLDTDGGFVIVSKNITGQLPSPPYVSALWYSSEAVYSGYDSKGRLLWRNSFDNTPEAMKNYDPVSDPLWRDVSESHG